MRELRELCGMNVSTSKAMEGMKHAVEIDGHVYVSPAMMTLLETDFMETMRSLKVLKVVGKRADIFRAKIRP